MATVEITPAELESLEEVLNYLHDEKKNLEENVLEGGVYEEHIQFHIDKLWIWLQKVSGKVVS